MAPHPDQDLKRERLSVTAAGHRLAVERLTPPGCDTAGATLVFLHEGLGCIAQWRDIPSTLAAATGLPAVNYDRWGFGGSDPLTLPRPSNYLEEEARIALPQLLDACRVRRPILIGHSDGGSIALIHAAAFPGVAAGVIAEAAHVFVEEITLAGIRAAVVQWQTTDLPRRLARHHGDKSEAIFRGWAETWLSAEFRNWNIEQCLSDITCPTLIIQGANDEYGSIAQVQAIAAGIRVTTETLVVPNCGHTPHLERRDIVVPSMAAFASRIAASIR